MLLYWMDPGFHVRGGKKRKKGRGKLGKKVFVVRICEKIKFNAKKNLLPILDGCMLSMLFLGSVPK